MVAAFVLVLTPSVLLLLLKILFKE